MSILFLDAQKVVAPFYQEPRPSVKSGNNGNNVPESKDLGAIPKSTPVNRTPAPISGPTADSSEVLLLVQQNHQLLLEGKRNHQNMLELLQRAGEKNIECQQHRYYRCRQLTKNIGPESS